MRAAIDVGTNTVRLLIGDIEEGRVVPHRYWRRICRLGGEYHPRTGLSLQARERTLSAMHQISRILEEEGVSSVQGVGTAILREAPNGSDFAAQVKGETGLPLEIISGEEEARLTSLGVLSALEPCPNNCLIMDIGGGSTEFVLWQDNRMRYSGSFPLGVVTLCESAPTTLEQQERIDGIFTELTRRLVAENLLETAVSPSCPLVGTAGTVTTLAAMKLGMTDYDWRRVNNLPVERPLLEDMLRTLLPMSLPQREQVPGMEEGRGDLIVPGLRVVLAALATFRKRELVVSDFGLLEGVLLRTNKVSPNPSDLHKN